MRSLSLLATSFVITAALTTLSAAEREGTIIYLGRYRDTIKAPSDFPRTGTTILMVDFVEKRGAKFEAATREDGTKVYRLEGPKAFHLRNFKQTDGKKASSISEAKSSETPSGFHDEMTILTGRLSGVVIYDQYEPIISTPEDPINGYKRVTVTAEAPRVLTGSRNLANALTDGDLNALSKTPLSLTALQQPRPRRPRPPQAPSIERFLTLRKTVERSNPDTLENNVSLQETYYKQLGYVKVPAN